jgi:hypothetical protein
MYQSLVLVSVQGGGGSLLLRQFDTIGGSCSGTIFRRNPGHGGLSVEVNVK